VWLAENTETENNTRRHVCFVIGFGYPATAVSGQRIRVGYVRIIIHAARATAVVASSFAAGARVSGFAVQDGRRSYFIIFGVWSFLIGPFIIARLSVQAAVNYNRVILLNKIRFTRRSA